MWHIAKKEFLTNILTVRFVTGLLLCLFLVPFTLMVSVQDYRARVTAYEVEHREADRKNGDVKVWSMVQPILIRPPEPMSIFRRGISGQTGTQVTVILGQQPFIAEGTPTSGDNPLLNRFFTIDFVTVIGIILSLLGLIFTYDACTGEREAGTLKLVFANPVGRATVLFGKVMGVLLTLVPLIMFAYGIGVLYVILQPDIAFTAGEWGRIALLFGTGILLAAFFVVTGVFVSARSHTSVASIVICLFIWVTTVFLIPALSVAAARSLVTIESPDNMTLTMDDLDRAFFDEVSEIEKTIPRPDWFMTWWYSGNDLTGEQMIVGASKSYFEYNRQLQERLTPLRLEYADKKRAVQQAYLESLDHQRRVADWFGTLSPTRLFLTISGALARTDAAAQYRFLDAVRAYRESLTAYFRNRDLFSSYAWFTPADPAKFLTGDEMITRLSGGELTSVSQFNNNWGSLNKGPIPQFSPEMYPLLDLSGLPSFQYVPKTADDLKAIAVTLGLLIGAGIILFFFAFVSFTRYDVR